MGDMFEDSEFTGDISIWDKFKVILFFVILMYIIYTNMNNLKCLSYQEKKEYLNSINTFYNYDNKAIEFMVKKNICFGDLSNIVEILDEKKILMLKKLLKLTDKFLKENKITYWLDSGTLLGCIRNKKIIPWDDDIDLGIPESDYNNLIRVFANMGQDKDGYYISEKYKIKFFDTDRFHDVNTKLYRNKNVMFRVCFDTCECNTAYMTNVGIDLLLFLKLKNNRYAPNVKQGTFIYEFKDMYPLKHVEFEDGIYPIVNNPIPYLNRCYWFWKHLGLESHSHFKEITDRSKDLYIILNDTKNNNDTKEYKARKSRTVRSGIDSAVKYGSKKKYTRKPKKKSTRKSKKRSIKS